MRGQGNNPAGAGRAETPPLRATNDPVRLARAARIVRAAIERGRLTAESADSTKPGA